MWHIAITCCNSTNSFDRRNSISPFLNDIPLIINCRDNTIYDFLELDMLVDCYV